MKKYYIKSSSILNRDIMKKLQKELNERFEIQGRFGLRFI